LNALSKKIEGSEFDIVLDSEGAYVWKRPGGKQPEWTEEASVDLDLTFLLPRDPDASEWEAPLSTLGHIVSPQGSIPRNRAASIEAFMVDAPPSDGILVNIPLAGVTLPIIDLVEVPNGGHIHMKKMANEENASMVPINIELDGITADIDVRPVFLDVVASGIPGYADYTYAHDVSTHLKGNGQLLWNSDAKRLESFRLKADVAIEERIGFSLDFMNPKTGQKNSTSIDRKHVWKGSIDVFMDTE
jgi:hypothetical protein